MALGFSLSGVAPGTAVDEAGGGGGVRGRGGQR